MTSKKTKKIRKIVLTILFVLINIVVIAATALNEFGNSKDAAEEDGVAEAYTTISVLTVNEEGVITSSILDAVQAKITFDATIGEDTYTYEKEDVTIAPSKYYQCTLTMTKTAGPY